MKEAVQCLCEGGRGCTREDPARQKEANAVPGLHCSWVGQHVLAMARPWQDNVVKFDLVNKFKDLNIGMIINLQEVCSNSKGTNCRTKQLMYRPASCFRQISDCAY
jgi:protein tyrosine phosphatase domain-containing protein 1